MPASVACTSGAHSSHPDREITRHALAAKSAISGYAVRSPRSDAVGRAQGSRQRAATPHVVAT
jgi:hypothetical protein